MAQLLEHVSDFSIASFRVLFLVHHNRLPDLIYVRVTVLFSGRGLGPKVLELQLFGFPFAQALKIVELGFFFSLIRLRVVVLFHLHLELLLFFHANFMAALQISHLLKIAFYKNYLNVVLRNLPSHHAGLTE